MSEYEGRKGTVVSRAPALSLGAPTPMETSGNCVTVATNVPHGFCILERVSSLPAISFRHPRTDIADSNRPCVPSCFESAEFAEFKLGELRDTEVVPPEAYIITR